MCYTGVMNNPDRFGGNREVAIQRDGEKCVECNMTRSQHLKKYGRDITVNHIDGKGRYTSRKDQNHNLENLETLCLSCHGRKDGIRRLGLDKRKVNSTSYFDKYCNRWKVYINNHYFGSYKNQQEAVGAKIKALNNYNI